MKNDEIGDLIIRIKTSLGGGQCKRVILFYNYSHVPAHAGKCRHMPAFVRIQTHAGAYAGIRRHLHLNICRHMPAYAGICLHSIFSWHMPASACICRQMPSYLYIFRHMQAYARIAFLAGICRHMPAYTGICRHIIIDTTAANASFQ